MVFIFIDLISFLIGVPEKILLLTCLKGIILSNGIKVFDAKGSKILFALPIIAFCSWIKYSTLKKKQLVELLQQNEEEDKKDEEF